MQFLAQAQPATSAIDVIALAGIVVTVIGGVCGFAFGWLQWWHSRNQTFMERLWDRQAECYAELAKLCTLIYEELVTAIVLRKPFSISQDKDNPSGSMVPEVASLYTRQVMQLTVFGAKEVHQNASELSELLAALPQKLPEPGTKEAGQLMFNVLTKIGVTLIAARTDLKVEPVSKSLSQRLENSSYLKKLWQYARKLDDETKIAHSD
jgi:hypothetical protein